MRTVGVLSYNIHKGFTSGNRRFVLEQIRQAIREVHADVVMLQEVLGEHEKHRRRLKNWPLQSQFEFLADDLWPHYAYGRNAIYTEGHHGNAILSKFPFISWENIDVSTNRLERRGLLHGTIEIPGRKLKIHVICLHLGLIETERMEQIETLCRRVNEMVPRGEPLIVAGDFNDWRKRVSRPLMEKLDLREAFELKEGAAARTFPSFLPALSLDRIYFRGLRLKCVKRMVGRPWAQLSDHVAIYSELEV